MKQKILDHICSLLRGRVPTGLTPKDWESIVRVSRSSSMLARMSAMLTHNLRAQIPEYVIEQFDAANKHSELLARQVFFEAHELNLHINNCSSQPAIFLKGSAYVLSQSTVGRGRVFSDIDILVRKDDLPSIEKRLQALAWFPEPIDDYDQKYYREWAHEIPPMIRAGRGTVADIHHNLIPPISGKAPDINLFLSNLQKLDCGYYTLSPHAMTLHSIIHLFYQEEFVNGFRDLSDLHLLFIENAEIPDFHSLLLQLAKDSNFCTELYYACRYLQMFFDTEIDKHFLSQLSAYKPSYVKLIVLDWMFTRVLMPRHTLVNKPLTSLAHQMAFIRGHWLKMPVHILFFHSFNKLKFVITHFFTGKKKSAQLSKSI